MEEKSKIAVNLTSLTSVDLRKKELTKEVESEKAKPSDHTANTPLSSNESLRNKPCMIRSLRHCWTEGVGGVELLINNGE